MKSEFERSRLWIAAALLLGATLFLWSCGDLPTAAVEQRGSIEVGGVLPDNSPADSIHVTLDEDLLGYFPNPHIIENLLVGTYWVEVRTTALYESDTLDYYSELQKVKVSHKQTTIATFPLDTDIPVSPYAGYVAPDFELNDIESNLVSLSGLAGEVVLLYFFTAT